MTTTKHTAGPWRYDGRHDIEAGVYAIASVYATQGPFRETAIANAHLIAAAPNLAEVAQLAYTFMGNILDNDTLTEYEQAIHDKAEAALVAIYGRENVSY